MTDSQIQEALTRVVERHGIKFEEFEAELNEELAKIELTKEKLKEAAETYSNWKNVLSGAAGKGALAGAGLGLGKDIGGLGCYQLGRDINKVPNNYEAESKRTQARVAFAKANLAEVEAEAMRLEAEHMLQEAKETEIGNLKKSGNKAAASGIFKS